LIKIKELPKAPLFNILIKRGERLMAKLIPDKAEVSVEYPDKLYIGSFGHTARFDAHLDKTGIALTLHHTGTIDERKSVHMHFHYKLFAEILRDLARTVTAMPSDNGDDREALRDAAWSFYVALKAKAIRNGEDTISQMTTEEQVLLSHLME
jgi:hypothetical protein